MTPVERMLSATFWAVPAFMRVEPERISAPVSRRIGNSATLATVPARLLKTPTVRAPHSRACRNPARV